MPLFYYVGHFTLIHVIAALVCQVRYGTMWYMVTSPDLANFPFTAPPDWGYSLPLVWAWWITVVVALYPPCRWFAGVKARRRGPVVGVSLTRDWGPGTGDPALGFVTLGSKSRLRYPYEPKRPSGTRRQDCGAQVENRGYSGFGPHFNPA